MKRYVFSVLVIAVLTCLAGAQQASAPSNSVGQTSTTQGAAVPTLVRYYGVAKDLNGNPLTDVVGATFALYTEETGGAALWIETQNVYPDATGHYSVQLGATRAEGLPLDLFVSGEARWLGIQISGQAEQPRVLLLSVPYALKAGDAATIGGLPPSAFMLANPANTPSSATQLKNPFTSKSASTPGSSTVTTSGGTVNAIPLFSTSTDIENSILSQRVTSNSSSINVNGSTSAPGALNVDNLIFLRSQTVAGHNYGYIQLNGAIELQNCCAGGVLENVFVGNAGNFNYRNGVENSGLGWGALGSLNGGKSSQNTAAGYEALGHTTTGTQNTAVGAWAGNPPEGNSNITGSQNTFIGFATGPGAATQLFNATALGSNAAVSESNALVLGSIAGLNGATNNTNVGIGTSAPAYTLDVEAPSGFNPTVNFGNSTQTANFTMNGTANITGSLYVNGQQVTGGGGNGGSGTVTSVGLTAPSTDFLVTGSPITASGTLGLAWLVPPTSTDTPSAIVKRDTSGNISAATVNADTQFNLGGTMFDSGSSASNDAFLGFAGNGTNPGTGNVAAGWQALSADTSGGSNVAAGYKALNNDTTGSFNVAVGNFAGQSGDGSPMTGNNNTFVGGGAEASYGSNGSGPLTNATAIGSNAVVGASNSLVLGSITGLNNATANTNVGIGTTTPGFTFDVEAPSGSVPSVNFGNSSIPSVFSVNGTTNLSSPGTALNVTGTANFNSLYVNGVQITGSGGGSGTVTSVGLTAPSTDFLVTGSPITASGTLGLAWLVPPTSTDTPSAIVKRDTSGNISAATVNADTQFNLGGTMFDSGSSASNDAFLGFAGNGTNPGTGNVAAGWQALSADTSGGSNVAAGYKALNNDTTGSFNVAVGNFAGQSGDGSPMTGNNNTFVGGGAEASYGSNGSGPLTNATAVGSNAVVGESNALVLGSVCCLNNATSNTKVGIGTTTPGATLDVEAPAGTGAPTVNIGNSANNAVVNVTGTLNLNGQSIGSGSGISTINTPLGSGLAGGGNSSTLNLSLASAGCTAGQVMSWTGSLWACSTVSGGGGGSGTVTSVAGGTGIVTTPSPITGAGTVAIDPTVVPQLGAANNNFTGNENVTGSISVVPNAYMNAMTASGFSAAYGSQGGGSNAIQAFGGSGDSSSTTPGGMGILSEGGSGGVSDGDGGSFVGGYGGPSSGFGDGIHAVAGSGYAGNFYGDLNVTGAITAGTKDFKIDHPLDPANKYLVHASVESSEMMNIYTGNVVTDAEGNASVDLPEWFEALNTDFRYQLTVIGQFAQAIVANEVANNRFSIRTDKPNVKVSWQITAIRHDAFAKAHPLVVEQEKEARLKGYYIHPELHGAPAEKQIEWARHPELMQRIKQSHVRKTTAKANPRNSTKTSR